MDSSRVDQVYPTPALTPVALPVCTAGLVRHLSWFLQSLSWRWSVPGEPGSQDRGQSCAPGGGVSPAQGTWTLSPGAEAGA